MKVLNSYCIHQISADIEALKDVTPLVDIKASSRQAMVNSLTDNTTETFWESGDEDRNKVKVLNLSCDPKVQPRMVYLHIDNCRDLGVSILPFGIVVYISLKCFCYKNHIVFFFK